MKLNRLDLSRAIGFATKALGCLVVGTVLCWPGNEPETSETAVKGSQQSEVRFVSYPALQQSKKMAAAEFPDSAEWVNLKQQLKLADLKGKLVLLDFWTYCCINCMQILPVLKQAEAKYADELVVIGVHTAKFSTERDSKNIREAIERYEIRHPVLNDVDQSLWGYYGIDTWPTLVLIDPTGSVIWSRSGELPFKELDSVLRTAVNAAKSRSTLKKTDLKLDFVDPVDADSPLKFPGKVLADSEGNRLFVSDSNHNRIVIASFSGEVIDVIGSGAIGKADGSYEVAEFNHPQGLALLNDLLYVADTENHLIRKVDLRNRIVSTIAGTGDQLVAPWQGFSEKAALPKRIAKKPTATALASPWDLLIANNTLWIAMAGSHQIWRMSLDEKAIGQYAGNGREDIVDGPRLPSKPYMLDACSFAQPSGLATDGTSLFVADSEGSSIRTVPLTEDGVVRTLIGTAGLSADRLFTFGDRDGLPAVARMQHPLAVAVSKNKLFVADTYNNKVKWIDLTTGLTSTLVGNGQSGKSDAPPMLNEPGGLSIAGTKLYIADTNNHMIREWDLTKSTLKTLEWKGLVPPGNGSQVKVVDPFPKSAKRIAVPAIKFAEGAKEIELNIKLELPEGWKMDSQAPQGYVYQWSVGSKQITEPKKTRIEPATPEVQFKLAIPDAPVATLRVALTYYYCRDGEDGRCIAETIVVEAPTSKIASGSSSPSVSLTHQISEPKQ